MEKTKNMIIDLNLVNLIKQQNGRESQKAFTKLFDKYYNIIKSFFSSKLKDDYEADDLALNVFFKASKNINNYNENYSAFSTWLFTIAKNTFIDKYRAKNVDEISFTDLVREDEESDYLEFNDVKGVQTPEDIFFSKELNDKILKTICSIKNTQMQLMLSLRINDDFSYEEIAQITQKPMGTVKSFIFRGKELTKAKIISTVSI